MYSAESGFFGIFKALAVIERSLILAKLLIGGDPSEPAER
jgi:hypothetical protein